MNFELVFLSPKYTNLMHKSLDQPSLQKQFNDWNQMSLKNEVITELENSLQSAYSGALAGGSDRFDLPDGLISEKQEQKVHLVSQQCWSKITYFFGLHGPEIMFFCQQDPLTKQYMPDLNPVKLGVC